MLPGHNIPTTNPALLPLWTQCLCVYLLPTVISLPASSNRHSSSKQTPRLVGAESRSTAPTLHNWPYYWEVTCQRGLIGRILHDLNLRHRTCWMQGNYLSHDQCWDNWALWGPGLMLRSYELVNMVFLSLRLASWVQLISQLVDTACEMEIFWVVRYSPFVEKPVIMEKNCIARKGFHN